jgi:hypothetical protein
MRVAPLAVLALCALPSIAGADRPAPKPKPVADAPALAADEIAKGTRTLAALEVDSLTLIPIVVDVVPADGEKLLVLDEAMRTKKVRIHETSEDGSVNELKLTNKSDQPLFLLAGEVIIGGKQDRIIGKNTIIPAKKTQEVPVFCVEHGRWQSDGGKGEFTTANALAHGRLRARASFADQSEVWSEVAKKNELRKTENATDTYRNVAKQQSNGTLEGSEKKLKAALAKLPAADRARMVGYAVAINGAVASVDVFGSPALFQKLETKLVRSYLTEAIDVQRDKEAKPATVGDVKTFMADADAAAEEYAFDTDEAETVNKKGGKRADKASVRLKAKPGDAKPAADAYYNYSAK